MRLLKLGLAFSSGSAFGINILVRGLKTATPLLSRRFGEWNNISKASSAWRDWP